MTQSLDTEGKRLKYVREKILDMGQKAFGAAIAKDQSTIQKWESGMNGIDSSIKLLLEHVYGLNSAWLNTGVGEIIFERKNINAFQMPIYELSDKSYANLFKKDNIINNKSIIHADLTHDLANIFLIVANKSMPKIEKGDLLMVLIDSDKGKRPSHYLVEDNGVAEVRMLKYINKNSGIVELGYSKTSDIEGFSLDVDIASLEESQIKGKVIKIFATNLWKNASVILV